MINVAIENVGSTEFIGKYVDIQGGIPEIRETYEYGIGDMGDGEEMLASLFYYPVVLIEGGVPQFIVVSEAPPAPGADNPSSRVGLLKTQSDIPDKIMDVYAERYPDTSLILLDTQFTPAPIAEKYINFIAFLLLTGASILGFRYAIRE